MINLARTNPPAGLEAPSAELPISRQSQPNVGIASRFLIVSIARRIVFSIVFHCSCAGGFFVALSGRYIVIRVAFPLQIDCILLGVLSMKQSQNWK